MAIREGEEVGYDIKACFCGEGGWLCDGYFGNEKRHWVECFDSTCWRGPKAKTKNAAIRLWNGRTA